MRLVPDVKARLSSFCHLEPLPMASPFRFVFSQPGSRVLRETEKEELLLLLLLLSRVSCVQLCATP